jgi:ribosome production factor 1
MVHVEPNQQEHRREPDPTVIASDDPELLEETAHDPFSAYYAGAVDPRVKITTSGEEEAPLLAFGASLQVLIPNSVFERRPPGAPFSAVHRAAAAAGFTDLLVLVCANHDVHAVMHLHLPDGPTANYRITSIVLPAEIPGRAATSEHHPELVMKHFTTRVGRLCARMLRAVFPLTPNHYGRRVATFHNQRDFVFFRHYRYVFESAESARLQEAGPRFTLRLLWLQEGPFDPANGQYTFYRRGRHEKSRLKWWL